MRIAHIIPALTKGGAEKVLVDLGNEAFRRGHSVAVVTGYPADPRLIRNRLNPSVEVRTISQREGDKLSAYGGMPIWLWRNREWLDTFDVVHCHLTYAALLGTGLKLSRQFRGHHKPAIVETFHGVGMPIRFRQRWVASALARHRDGFALMAEDPFWSDFIARNAHMPSRIIPNGLTLDQPKNHEASKQWRAAQAIPENTLVIGTIGRIRAERNPMATLEAFSHVAKELPDAHFVMGGEGPMLEDVRAAARQCGLGERLHLPGLVLDPQEVLPNIDVYLSINVGPVTGLAGLEAAGAGVAVIAIQARTDHIVGSEDWIWSDPSPHIVAKELLRLAKDEKARTELACRQQAHVAKHFSVSAMQDAYEELYALAMAKA
jgi:glycosyltransferase involved in cell wall biosynthesis